MNAVQIAGYWVPARETLRELPPEPLREPAPPHAVRHPAPHAVRHPLPPLTTLLRRRAAWALAAARVRPLRPRG
ncbi:hypothetical protein ACGFXC_31165 [Streptomyces sp. NPDC048507]|uniref:hypothetical protein n=1 Tax=Streptomyces sp. NPDC048507 TaxID=3365560 RepID=UPI00372278B6